MLTSEEQALNSIVQLSWLEKVLTAGESPLRGCSPRPSLQASSWGQWPDCAGSEAGLKRAWIEFTRGYSCSNLKVLPPRSVFHPKVSWVGQSIRLPRDYATHSDEGIKFLQLILASNITLPLFEQKPHIITFSRNYFKMSFSLEVEVKKVKYRSWRDS